MFASRIEPLIMVMVIEFVGALKRTIWSSHIGWRGVKEHWNTQTQKHTRGQYSCLDHNVDHIVTLKID